MCYMKVGYSPSSDCHKVKFSNYYKCLKNWFKNTYYRTYYRTFFPTILLIVSSSIDSPPPFLYLPLQHINKVQ